LATSKKQGNTYSVTAGLDIGNGYTKGRVDVGGTVYPVDIPSAMAYTSAARLAQPVSEESLSDLANSLDATVLSPAIPSVDRGRVLFGKRAITSKWDEIQFQIDSPVPKSRESLSVMLILDAIVSQVIAVAGFKGTLPTDIEVDAKLALALPIDDYLGHHTEYRESLMREPHRVIVHNFGTDVEVKTTFSDVVVVAEGVAALAALKNRGEDFLDKVVSFERASGATFDAAYTGEALAAAQNIVGIDIGEGTTNFAVFTNGTIDTDNSKSINRGFGTILDEVLDLLRQTDSGIPADSRGALEKILLSEPTLPKQQRIKARVEKELQKVIPTFVNRVTKTFSNVWRSVGAQVEVVYIYGGGASFVRDALVPRISQATESDGMETPVICLDSSYSRVLNADGLFRAAENL